MSQQEDDLRALAKIMDFLRAVSIILVVMNVYWFCYEAIWLWGVDIGVVDRILMNFNRTAGLFRSILYTKLFAVLLLALSCLGTKGVKGEKITWGRIWTALAVGFVLFFLNWWILALPLPIEAVTGLYILTVGAGYVCLLMGGLWMSRLLKHNLMDDVFNNENEKLHAGNTAHRKRVFGQSAHTLLLQETLEQRLDQCREPVPCLHRFGYTGQRKVICGGKQFYQTAD